MGNRTYFMKITPGIQKLKTLLFIPKLLLVSVYYHYVLPDRVTYMKMSKKKKKKISIKTELTVCTTIWFHVLSSLAY